MRNKPDKNFWTSFFSRFKSTGQKQNVELKKKIRELSIRTEEAEAKSRRLEVIFYSMFEGVIALDAKLNITLVNPRICSLYGFDSAQNITNISGMSLLSFSRSTELEAAAAQVLLNGKPQELTVRRYTSGIEQHFHVFIAPLETNPPGAAFPAGLSPQQESCGAVIVMGDISRLVKLEQVRKDFAANVSHELRTPIQVAKGFAENILDSPLNNKEEIRRFVEIIKKNIQTMENLTNDLLTLVSMEDEDAVRPSMQETAIAPIIAEAVDMLEFAAGKKNISVNTSCPPDLRAKLYAPFIIQALVNLLDNAINYSGSGSFIKVEAFRKGEQLIIEVKDEGIGIPSEHLGRIFERFYRVDRSRSREAGGTGLGLAIVRHIALLHNGSAEVESHAGEGSVFRLRLPC